MSQDLPYEVVITPDEGGYYLAQCPALPGCISQGRSPGEARANIAEAMSCYLECLASHGECAPPRPGEPERS